MTTRRATRLWGGLGRGRALDPPPQPPPLNPPPTHPVHSAATARLARPPRPGWCADGRPSEPLGERHAAMTSQSIFPSAWKWQTKLKLPPSLSDLLPHPPRVFLPPPPAPSFPSSLTLDNVTLDVFQITYTAFKHNILEELVYIHYE